MVDHRCPECNSLDTRKHGKNQLHCKSCGKYPVVLPPGKRWANKKDDGGAADITVETTGESQYLTGTVLRHMTNEELYEHFKIDKKEWEIQKVKYANIPIYRKDRKGEWSSEGGVVSGWSEDSGKMVVELMFGVQVWTRRRTEEIKMRDAGEGILKRLKKGSLKIPRKKYKPSKDGLLLQIMMPDIHLGRITRREQSGEDYSMKIATEVVSAALESLLQKAARHNVAKIFLPFGNDAFNSDNHLGTTAKGTPQQEESWWIESFLAGEALFSYMIDRMTEIAPVEVMFLPGNHDPHRLWYFGEWAKAIYSKNKNVRISNSSIERQYYNFGYNVFALTHGDSDSGLIKLNKLPSTITFELRKNHPDWLVKAKTIECHMGHLHHKQEMEWSALDGTGVTFRFFRSLTTADSWHFRNMFVGSVKAAEALLWTPGDGLYAQFPAVIDQSRYNHLTKE